MTDYAFEQLIDVEQVRQLLETHHQLSGMAYGLFDNNENDIVSVGWQDICTRFHRTHPVCSERCRESNAFIKTHLHEAGDEYLEYRCGNGMIDVAMPIVIEGRHLATLFVGQFFYEDDPLDREFFLTQVWKFGFDQADYLAALDRVPIFSRERVRANLMFLLSLVRMLAESGLKSLRLVRETELRMKEEEREANLRLLKNMERINRAIQGTYNLKRMLNNVIGVTFSIFGCDRAYLMHPCDPAAETCEIFAECTHPDYPGAKELGGTISNDLEAAARRHLLLSSDGPVTMGPEASCALSGRTVERFGIRSAMAMALHPKTGNPWELGVQQCSFDRVWTPGEERLLREIGRRLEDAMTSLLTIRDLRESEARYRRIIDTSAEGIVMVDQALLISFANQRMAEMLGYSIEEATGLPVTGIWLEEDVPDLLNKLENRRLGISEFYDCRLRHRDGRIIWTHVSATPIFDAKHQFNGSFAMFTDITERKRMEEELAAREREFRTLAGNIPDNIARWDLDGRYLYINRIQERTLGTPAGAVIGTPIPDSHAAIKAALTRVVATGKAVTSVSQPVQVNGMTELHDVSLVPEFDETGRIVSVLGLGRDMTGTYRLHEALAEREQIYRATVENSPDIIVRYDRECRRIYVNPACARLIGVTPESMLGIRPADSSPALARQEYHDAVRQALESGEEVEYECAWRSVRGETFVYGFRFVPESGPDGDVTSVLAIGRDITGRIRNEEALRESEHRYRMLADNVSDVVWVADISGKITYISPSVERFSGFSVRERIGMTPEEIFTPASAALVRERLSVYSALILAGERLEPERLELENRRKDGTVMDIEVNVSAMYDSAGKFAGFLGVARDITERKRIEAQLHQSQKMEAIGQLAGGIAHDFNNIMTAITGFAHIVGMKLGDSPLNAYLDRILASAERASSLTGDLLAFSRKQVMQLRLVDIGKAIADSRQLISRLLREDIELSVSLPDEPFTVIAGENHLTQILMNLAANARDAMPCGGTINIGVVSFSMDRNYVTRHGYGKVGRYALITFADTGRGMDEKTREKIFEPFFTTKEVGKGTGLGLATVYGIVKQLGGFINVYSEPGKGTIFRIYLPLIGGAEPVEDTTQSAISSTGGAETILLAEDDPDVREFAESLLREYGYEVLSAVDGDEALRIFSGQGNSIDLLVLDAVMPGKNGIEVFQTIQKTHPRIKAIMMSGYTSEIMIVNGLIERGLKFLQKPVNPREFLRTVREVLDR